MGFHTYPIDRADALEDPSRYRFCSREELLELLALEASAVVADVGSGTGFYTADVAPFAGTVYAVDVQPAMHRRHRENGVAANVELVTADVESLPFADDSLDAAFSTMTHHEYASEAALADLARVVRPGGRLVTVDWSADGSGEDGPPLDERFGAEAATAQLETAGFAIDTVRDRPETFAIAARVQDR